MLNKRRVNSKKRNLIDSLEGTADVEEISESTGSLTIHAFNPVQSNATCKFVQKAEGAVYKSAAAKIGAHQESFHTCRCYL